MKIGFIGFQGVGKSVMGKQVADILDVPHIDLDLEIESELNHPIRDAYKKLGSEQFREVENRVFERVKRDNIIVSFGGGALLPITRSCDEYYHIYLYRPYEELFEELSKRIQKGSIPLWLPPGDIEQNFSLIWNERHSVYSQSASSIVYARDGSLDNQALKLAAELRKHYGKQ